MNNNDISTNTKSSFTQGLEALTAEAYTDEQIHASLTDLQVESVKKVIETPWGTTPNQSAELAARCAKMPRTDFGLGQRIAAAYEGHLVFMLDLVSVGTWWSYNGFHWAEDEINFLAKNAARVVIASIESFEGDAILAGDADYQARSRKLAAYEASPGCDPELVLEQRKGLNEHGRLLVKEHTDWSSSLQNGTGHLEAGIAAAAGILAATGGFNKLDDHINTPAGYLNLRTLECAPHDPEHYVSKITAGSYVPLLVHPDIEKILTGLERQGEGNALHFQRFLGMAMTGINIKAFLYVDGVKNSAKSTLLQAAVQAAGGYGQKPSAAALVYSARAEAPSPAMHDLRGCRIAFGDEADKVKTGISGPNFLLLTSGGEMNTRTLNKKPERWKSQVTAILAGNGRIKLDGNDEGMAARMYGVSFPHTLTKGELEEGFALRVERNETGQMDALFSWMIEGSNAWLEEGATADALKQPAAAKAYTDLYLEEANPFNAFLEMHAEVIPEGQPYLPLKIENWFELYVQFCIDQGIDKNDKMESPKFKAAMAKAGYEQRKTATTMHHAGWTINTRFVPGITPAGVEPEKMGYLYPALFKENRRSLEAPAPVAVAPATVPTLSLVPDWAPMDGASTEPDENEGYYEYEA